MIVAILSDIHGNLPALEQCLRRTRPVADRFLCLGDVVNYGPWNDECLDVVLGLPGITLLEGNHERLFRGAERMEHEIPLVQAFTRHSMQWFTRHEAISGLPTESTLGSYTCIHTIDGKNVYVNTVIDIDRNYIIGHTHQQYQVVRDGHTIVNPGSVGQNRGCIDVISYALFDTETARFTLCEETYPVDLLLSELRSRSYPQECIDYYANKPRKGVR